MVRSRHAARLETGVPLPSLSKVLNSLGQAGLVKAKRGYKGGFMLARSGDEITLRQVAEAVDPKLNQPRCFLGFAECSEERSCPAHDFWCRTRKKTMAYLEDLTVADVGDFEWNRQNWPFHRVREEDSLPVLDGVAAPETAETNTSESSEASR